MKTFTRANARAKTPRQIGMSLVELLIAMLILSIGMAAMALLLSAAMLTNKRNSWDTTATLLAQKVIEQIASVNPAAPNNVTITDCNGNAQTISTVDAAGPAGAGANLVTAAGSINYGNIDQTQSLGSIPAGYAMQYVDCSIAGGQPTTYDVRWNIMTLRAGSTRLITASARPVAANAPGEGGVVYAIPVSLRSIGATP